MKLKKLHKLLVDDYLITDLDNGYTHLSTVDLKEELDKEVVNICAFYDQVLVKVCADMR
jgi:hypothetical protein